jgi:hypothetical protein
MLGSEQGKVMDQGIFKKRGGFSLYLGMAGALALAGVSLGNFISIVILAACEAVGLNVGEGATFITIPIGCAIIAAALVEAEGKSVEKAANLKVSLMMLVLRLHKKLTDEEIDAFYEGMRDVELDDPNSGGSSFGQGYSE